jgi:hypothetical protein
MTPMIPRPLRSILVVAAALTLLRCGSSPNSPSGAGAKLQGVVLQDATAHAQSLAQSAQAGKITVTVQEDPSLTVTVSGNGTFEIQGVPAGGFTLVFSLNGTTIGCGSGSPRLRGTTIKIVRRSPARRSSRRDRDRRRRRDADGRDGRQRWQWRDR